MEDKLEVFKFTVGELIEALKLFPKDLPVLVNGYENGYENIRPLKIQRVKHLPDNKHWDGQFQIDEKGVEVLVIDREYRSV